MPRRYPKKIIRRSKKQENLETLEEEYEVPLLEAFPINATLPAEVDVHAHCFPMPRSAAFPEVTLLNLVWFPDQGYPRHSGITRDDQIFTAADHRRVTLAAEMHGEDFEAIAREVGRPQWAIAAFHEWQMYLFGVWFIYGIVEAGRQRRWTEAEIKRAVGENVQMLYDGVWEENFAAPLIKAHLIEQTRNKQRGRVAGRFVVEHAENVERRKENEDPKKKGEEGVKESVQGEGEGEEDSESDSVSENEQGSEGASEKATLSDSMHAGGAVPIEGEGHGRKGEVCHPQASSSLASRSLSEKSRIPGRLFHRKKQTGAEADKRGEKGRNGVQETTLGARATQKVVVATIEGTDEQVGLSDMIGVTWNKGAWLAQSESYRKNVFWYRSDRLQEAAMSIDGYNRCVYGDKATCNFTIDGRFFLFPFGGSNAGKYLIHQGRQSNLTNMPPHDLALVRHGIYNLEQWRMYQETGTLMAYAGTEEGMKMKLDHVQVLLAKQGRTGAPLGVVPGSLLAPEGEQEEEDEEGEGSAGSDGGSDNDREEEDEWETEFEKEDESSGGESDEWEPYHSSVPSFPPPSLPSAPLLPASSPMQKKYMD